jgi:2-polyprenyl-6-methoxyphenol hydroxylase-like FAD-dependent oxidoreductase
MNNCDVLIVGAGPSGLVLALWLTRLGVACRIIDKSAGPGTTSRAVAVQARTLELYRQMDLTEAVLAGGHRVPAVNLWVKGERAASVSLADIGEGLTPYAFAEMFPQDAHERLLVERLEAAGVQVERRTELASFVEADGAITARLTGPTGESLICNAAYLVGCDGSKSVVRHAIGGGFPGGTYRQVFYVADVEATGAPIDGGLHIDLDEADFLAIFPLDHPKDGPQGARGRARLIGTVRDERAERAETLVFEDVSDRAIRNLKIEVKAVNWFSTYHVHHRVTDHFRKGRALLAGDAAHIHSPAGGQGMNTGIGDSINLAWKLAAVVKGTAPQTLLDSYEAERMAFARRLVSTTDRIFSAATAEGPVADLLRTRVAPVILPLVTSFEPAREFLFRTISQITLNYREGPLSAGTAGHVHGGDRLPWVVTDGLDNFESLNAIAWQVHVYGEASASLSAWCADHGLALHRFAWSKACGEAGFAKNAAYLLRPDTYVALADPTGSPLAIERFLLEHGIKLG